GTRLSIDYEKDLVGFDFTFPTGERLASLVVTATGFRFTTKDYWLASLPKLELTSAISEHWLHRTVDVLDPNDTFQDKNLFVTTVGSYTDYVTSETPTTRVMTLTFDDLIEGQGDQSKIDVVVNGTVAHADLVLAGNIVSVPVTLERGENTIRIVGKQGHAVGRQ